MRNLREPRFLARPRRVGSRYIEPRRDRCPPVSAFDAGEKAAPCGSVSVRRRPCIRSCVEPRSMAGKRGVFNRFAPEWRELHSTSCLGTLMPLLPEARVHILEEPVAGIIVRDRSEEQTTELQSLKGNSDTVFGCEKKKLK